MRYAAAKKLEIGLQEARCGDIALTGAHIHIVHESRNNIGGEIHPIDRCKVLHLGKNLTGAAERDHSRSFHTLKLPHIAPKGKIKYRPSHKNPKF